VSNLDTSRRWLSRRAGRVLAGCGRGGYAILALASRFSSLHASLRRYFLRYLLSHHFWERFIVCEQHPRDSRQGLILKAATGYLPLSFIQSFTARCLSPHSALYWNFEHTPRFGSTVPGATHLVFSPSRRAACSLTWRPQTSYWLQGQVGQSCSGAVQMPIASSRACPPCRSPGPEHARARSSVQYGRLQTN
jgi:hypothetical protein